MLYAELTSMSDDALGAASAVVITILLAVSHLYTARNPDRNAFTRALRNYYNIRWPLVGSGHPWSLLIIGVGSVGLALFFLGMLIYELSR